MKIVILDGYAANPGDLDYHRLEQLGEVVVYPRTSDEEKVTPLVKRQLRKIRRFSGVAIKNNISSNYGAAHAEPF